MRALRESCGIEDINTDWASYQHTTDAGIFNEIFATRFDRAPRADESSAMLARFIELVAQHEIVEIPCARAFMDALREAGYHVAIASGCWRVSAELKLARAGFAFDDLPAAYCDDDVSRAGIMRTAAQRADAQRFLYFGDGVWDARASRQLGVRMIGIGPHEARLRAEGVADHFRDYRDPAALLASVGRELDRSRHS